MAKRDDKDNQPTRRVYKSSDVHRRRVGDSLRAKPAKMPSKREARESARESTRIAAESRVDKTDKVDKIELPPDEIAEETVQPVEEAPEEKPKSRFTVIKGRKSASTEETASKEPEPETHRDETDSTSDTSDSERDEPHPSEDEPPSQFSSDEKAKPRRRSVADAEGKLPKLQPRTIVIAAVMAVAIVAVALFAFNRWGRYDDHADLQGTWYVLGTEVPITIDADTIRFNEEVSYNYEINPREKTISYTFGPMSGQGRYWFSDDRKHLVITDGDGYTAAGTTVDDLIHAFLDFSTAAGGGVVELPQGEGIIAFSRTPEVIETNQPAEGLVVSPSDESQAASSEAAQQAEGDESADQANTNEEASTEGGASADDESGDVAFEDLSEEPIHEEEAA